MKSQDERTLSAQEQERQKTAEERAADVAYTINHALICAATDIIDPFVAAWSQKNLGRQINTSWCNLTHDHGDNGSSGHDHHDHHDHHHHDHHHHDHHHHDHHHHHHDHHHHHHDHHNVTFGGALKHWVIGEAIGDLGAVPVAIAVQRHAPGFMQWVNDSLESVFGKVYQRSTQRTAANWALKAGLSPDDPQVKKYADELYHHEISHFGQAAVWTVASVGLNVASQKLITGNRLPVSYMVFYKTLGALTSATLLFGGRAIAPGKFQSWDRWTSKHVFTPMTKTVGKLFGVDEKAVEETIQRKEQIEHRNWTDKSNTTPDEQGYSGKLR